MSFNDINKFSDIYHELMVAHEKLHQKIQAIEKERDTSKNRIKSALTYHCVCLRDAIEWMDEVAVYIHKIDLDQKNEKATLKLIKNLCECIMQKPRELTFFWQTIRSDQQLRIRTPEAYKNFSAWLNEEHEAIVNNILLWIEKLQVILPMPSRMQLQAETASSTPKKCPSLEYTIVGQTPTDLILEPNVSSMFTTHEAYITDILEKLRKQQQQATTIKKPTPVLPEKLAKAPQPKRYFAFFSKGDMLGQSLLPRSATEQSSDSIDKKQQNDDCCRIL